MTHEFYGWSYRDCIHDRYEYFRYVPPPASVPNHDFYGWNNNGWLYMQQLDVHFILQRRFAENPSYKATPRFGRRESVPSQAVCSRQILYKIDPPDIIARRELELMIETYGIERVVQAAAKELGR